MHGGRASIRVVSSSDLYGETDLAKRRNTVTRNAPAWTEPPRLEDMQEKSCFTIKSKSISKYLSLRVIIVVSLLAATVTVGTLSWYLTYRSSQDSIARVTRSLQKEIQVRLSTSFNESLLHAEDIVATNKKIIESGLFNPLIDQDLQSLMKVFWSEVRTFRDSSTATITTTKGELWGHFIYPGTMDYGIWETVNGTTTEYYSDYLGGKGNVSWSNPDPGNLQGLWYAIIDPQNKDQSTWTDMYIWEDRFWITRSSGAYTKDGEFVGVVCSDLELGFVDSIISNVKAEQDVSIFVTDRKNHLIGSSIKLALVGCEGKSDICDGPHVAKVIDDFDNPLTKAVSKYMKDNPIKDNGSQLNMDTISIGGEDYFISSSVLRRDGLEWTITSLVSQYVYMSEITKNTWVTMTYVFTLIGGFEILLLGFSMFVTRPLKDIADAMSEISQLKFTHKKASVLGNSPIKEVSRIQKSFHKMDAALRTFGKFVPMSVVRRIMANAAIANDLYVERKALTIMFTDLKNFTKLAESLPIDTLLLLLADYLEEMTSHISKSDGVLCDFIGDGTMSFWNAPVSLKNHEVMAVSTALYQQASLNELNRYWIQQGYIREPLSMRIGIHTGDVLVGNIGSNSRMKYGAVGDAVNLSSRLEGLNKRYDTSLIISDTTYEAIKHAFICRPLENVIVKGRTNPVKIYEVLGPSTSNTNEHILQKHELQRSVFQAVQDFSVKTTAERERDLDILREYILEYNDPTAVRLLEIISDESYTGVSLLDEK